MSLVKKITICTGIDENNKPIWAQPQSIGVDSPNVILTTNILGENNLHSALSVFPDTAFSSENYGNILYLDDEGQIQVSNIPISWLQEKYEEENPVEPEQI